MMKRTFSIALATLVVGLIVQPAAGQSVQEKNKALLKQGYEYLNGANWEKMNDLVAPNFVDHNPSPGQKPGFEGVKANFQMMRQAFPDFHMTIHEMLADGDWVCARVTVTGTHKGDFMGMKASEKKFTVQGFDLIRFEKGKAVERYGTFDDAAMMMQLGMMPPPGHGGDMKKIDEMKK
ncbi:MAG: ester cyclase [Bacteroidota bacterium]